MKYWGKTALAAALAIAAGGPAIAGDIIWARDGDIDSLDPHRATSTLSRQVWYQIYDSLLEFDDSGAPVPNLAKSWEIAQDGTLVTFVLNEGITCHDGTPFNADDVIWTAERALGEDNPSLTKSSWGDIGEVEKIDDLTVAFHLATPFGAFVPFMADQFTSMLCDSNAAADDFGTGSAIGTGPWKFASWTKGAEVVLEKNPDYVNYGRPIDNPGPPLADRLIMRTMPEAQTRMAGLRTGELQVIVPPIQEVKSLQDDPGVEVYVAQGTGQNMFLQFAVNRPPFDDKRARQAVSHAIDKDLAIKVVYGDIVERQYCPISKGVFGNDPEFCKQYDQDYDPEKAKALLAELGYGPDKPMEVTLATWTGDSRERMLQMLQNQLKKVNIVANIEVMDIGTLNARDTQENNKAEGPGYMDLMGWTWFDPDLLYLLWHSPGAYQGFQTPELDKILEDMRTTVDPDARKEIVHAAFKILLEEAGQVPIYTPGWSWLYAVSADAPGFKIGPFNRALFNAIDH
ncbi:MULTISPECIES: ABC transporter substrate-binding protein [Actibacterium]|uniref:Peptide/nickel transport system substrate-binding protein n=1 Tax=Actibacterium naphthalenivorans TaxID=1614693 RepID=A0A840CF54_9RHOB|nr:MULTISPECIES: ABC transporter substrate-binding protein [Actibacterium]MBB4023920.1 peptide/nickel transport system substrate-binding protein [Actibacterium naphthalenivorans]